MRNKKLIKQKEFIDAETGEIFEAVIVGEPYWKSDKGFVKVFAIGLLELLRDDEIFAKAGRLLLWIIAKKLDWNSYEFFMQRNEVMKALKISQRTYYTWVRTLMKRGIIERIGANYYRLKPRLAVKGQSCLAKINVDGEKYVGVDI
jgi:hypothetical protein